MTSGRMNCILSIMLPVALLAGCVDRSVTLDPQPSASNPTGTETTIHAAPAMMAAKGADVESQLSSFMDGINAALSSQGADYRVAFAEYVVAGGDAAGSIVIQKDLGNKRLGFDFVPGDNRRAWSDGGSTSTDDITYAIDQTGDAVPPFGGLSAAETDAAIVRAMNTWDAETCSALALARNPDFGIDIGLIAFLNSLGGSPFVFADIQHAGWRDINFGGGVLGVTFTFGFTDSSGNFTDVDNNGRLDAAFREIYYDPSWVWQDDGVSNIDVETVALHEAGHGLSQAHFGNISFKNDGSVMGAPRAVMNAFIFGVDRELYGTDRGGHCGNWSNWPQN